MHYRMSWVEASFVAFWIQMEARELISQLLPCAAFLDQLQTLQQSLSTISGVLGFSDHPEVPAEFTTTSGLPTMPCLPETNWRSNELFMAEHEASESDGMQLQSVTPVQGHDKISSPEMVVASPYRSLSRPISPQMLRFQESDHHRMNGSPVRLRSRCSPWTHQVRRDLEETGGGVRISRWMSASRMIPKRWAASELSVFQEENVVFMEMLQILIRGLSHTLKSSVVLYIEGRGMETPLTSPLLLPARNLMHVLWKNQRKTVLKDKRRRWKGHLVDQLLEQVGFHGIEKSTKKDPQGLGGDCRGRFMPLGIICRIHTTRFVSACLVCRSLCLCSVHLFKIVRVKGRCTDQISIWLNWVCVWRNGSLRILHWLSYHNRIFKKCTFLLVGYFSAFVLGLFGYIHWCHPTKLCENIGRTI